MKSRWKTCGCRSVSPRLLAYRRVISLALRLLLACTLVRQLVEVDVESKTDQLNNTRIWSSTSRWAFMVFCILAFVPFAGAQGVSGRIAGTVVDSIGAAIANATVTVSNQDTGVTGTTLTDARGSY